MDFQQIRDFVNPAVAQATGLQEVENLSMPVPVAYVPVQLVIDGALSLTSENPVQNKVIAVAIQNLDGRITAIEGQFSEGVTEAVNNWLAAHPEATTTVQDGAITYAKLDANLKGEVDQISNLNSAIITDSTKVTSIASGSDLNSYLTPGNYKITASEMGIQNAPSNNAARVIVLTTVNNANVIQYFIENNGVIYYRTHNASGWGTWLYLLNKNHYNALINSPAFTGTPTAPTAPQGTVNTQIATTYFVVAAVNALGKPVATDADAVVAIPANSDLNDYQTPGSYKIPSSGMGIQNVPANSGGRVIVFATGNNFNIVQYFIVNSGIIYYRTHNASGWGTWLYLLNTGHYTALLTSPAFTGAPTAPTPATTDVSDRLATTRFVASKVNALGTPVPTQNGARPILTNGTDFDNLLTPGSWNISSSVSANTMLHIPVANPGFLVVLQTASTANVTQLYVCTNQKIYIRFKDGTGWHLWYSIANTHDTETLKTVDKTYYNYFSAVFDSIPYNVAFASAPSPLPLYNYIGNTQNVHPKVLYFANGFGGHNYWMAYTPYPNTLDIYENPCIAYSDDGYTWTNISGNPLDDPNGDGYNSDTHLVYRPDTNTLECWYRYVYYYTSSARREKIYRQTTTDGVNWSTKELVLDSQVDGASHYLSPAIIFENGTYSMWVVDSGSIKYYTASATNITAWTLVRIYSGLSFSENGITYAPWHLDVIKQANEYIMLVMCTGNDTSRLFITVSSDNVNYDTPYVVLGTGASEWDTYVYRSCIVHDGSKYRIYYSARDTKNNTWGMAITESSTLTNFRGILA